MTSTMCRPLLSERRVYSPLATRVAAVLVSVALCVSYYPFQNVSFKAQLLIALAGVVALIGVPQAASANRKTLFLYVLTFLFLGLCYIHSMFYPPVTEYAQTKFLYLSYSLLFFSIIAPLPFLQGSGKILLAYSLFAFSLVFCLVNLTPGVGTANVRYSALGLSPTMMGKIVLIVGVFALTMSRGGVVKRTALFALLFLSVWSSVRTGSRGPVVALAVSYGVLLFLKGQFKNVAKFAVYVPLLLVVVLLALQFMPAEIAERFQMERLSIESHSDKGDRIFLWDVAITGLQHSWSGYGLGNYSAATFIDAPHNVILEAAYEVGIPLAVLYSAVILAPVLYLRSLARAGDRFLDFFIVLYVMMMVLSLISGEMTLTAAVMYLAGGFLWGFATERTRRSDGQSAAVAG